MAHQSARRGNLRLVRDEGPSESPPIVTDQQARVEFERLTQSLVDVAIEIMDLVDGDPDVEPNGDESEDHDGI